MKEDCQWSGSPVVPDKHDLSGSSGRSVISLRSGRCGAVLFLLLLSLLAAPVLADDITFQTDQTDYYFSTGTEAEIAIGYRNDIGNAVSGQLVYKITEGVSSGGFSYSSSNTQSTPMTVPAGSGDFTLNGLYSDSQKDIDVDISFKYSDGSGSKTVTLGTITIHFTDDTSGKNQQNPQTSSESQSSSSSNQQSSSAAQQMAGQMQQQQQNLINQMMNSQAQQPVSSQQALQNSQQSYNSESLKRQMEEKAEENAREKEALSKAISGDELLSSAEEKLSEEGYELSSESVNPESMDEGSFTREYKNQAGDVVTLSGNVNDGDVSSVEESFNPEEQESLIPESLLNNETYRSHLSALQQDGFVPVTATINYTKDEAAFEQFFRKSSGDDQNGEETENSPKITAKLTPDLEVVNEVKLIRADDYSWLFPVLLILLIAVLAVLGWFAYKKYFSGRDSDDVPVIADEGRIPFDYRSFALKLLDEAESAFEEGDYISAYGKAGQALRVYLSHRCYDGSEVTNEELLGIISSKRDYSGDKNYLKNLLDNCSSVEFAKGSADERQFDGFVRYIRNIIAEESI